MTFAKAAAELITDPVKYHDFAEQAAKTAAQDEEDGTWKRILATLLGVGGVVGAGYMAHRSGLVDWLGQKAQALGEEIGIKPKERNIVQELAQDVYKGRKETPKLDPATGKPMTDPETGEAVMEPEQLSAGHAVSSPEGALGVGGAWAAAGTKPGQRALHGRFGGRDITSIKALSDAISTSADPQSLKDYPVPIYSKLTGKKGGLPPEIKATRGAVAEMPKEQSTQIARFLDRISRQKTVGNMPITELIKSLEKQPSKYAPGVRSELARNLRSQHGRLDPSAKENLLRTARKFEGATPGHGGKAKFLGRLFGPYAAQQAGARGLEWAAGFGN